MSGTGTEGLLRRIGKVTWGQSNLKGNLLATPSVIWFGLFLFIPVFFVLAYGFATSSAFYTPTFERTTLENYQEVLRLDGPVISLTVMTLLVSVSTTLAAAAVAYPVSYFLARRVSEKWRGILVGLIVVPFWISFVVQVYSLLPFVAENLLLDQVLHGIGLGGPSSWLIRGFGYGTPGIVVPVLVYIWLPYMILPLFTSLLKLDKELIEAAQNLGAGPWRTFWNVTFPLSYRGLITGSILIFITTFGSFVEPGFFYGKTLLIGQYVYDNFYTPGRLPRGAAASIFVLVVTVVFLYLYMKYSEVEETSERAGRSRIGRIAAGTWSRISDGIERFQSRRRAPTPASERNADGGVIERPARGPLESLFDRIAERFGTSLLSIFTLLVLLAFYIPLFIVVLFSFNYNNSLASFSSFSLRWYLPEASAGAQEVRSFFGDPAMIGGMINSLIIGVVSTGLSLIIGTLAALAIARYRFRTRAFLDLMLYTGLVIPSIVMGISILLFITFLNDYFLGPVFSLVWKPGFESIIVGHTTFSIPIVIIVVLVSLKEFDRSIEEAAMNLGADEITTFFLITLPIIKPALVSAALLAFTFSFDELVVTLFLKGQGVETLPVVFWSTLSRKVPTPELNAASTIILLMSFVFVFVANKVQKGGALFRL